MSIYLISFFSSTLFIYMGERFYSNKNSDTVINTIKKIICFLIILIALLIPSIVAGLRDYSIGTDVLVYGNFWFNKSFFNDFSTYTKWATSSSIGYLYATFNYLISRFTINPHWFYFYYNFAENIIVYVAIKRNKDILNIPFAMLVYYFLFYNLFLNILRQGMALALILLSVSYIRNNQNVKYFICLFIAYLFHSTAFIGISLWLISYVLKLKFESIVIRRNFLIIVGILFSFFLIPFVNLFNNMGIIGDRYAAYVGNNNVGGGFYQHLIMFCLPTLILYLWSVAKKNMISQNYIYNFFYTVVIMATVLGFLTLRFTYLNRLVEYFDIIFILAIPYIVKNGTFRVSVNNQNILSSLLIVYLFIYWVVIFVIMNSGETVPYLFMQY
ncbi:EpsG family protein [Limosilactobacillus reuteri]|uniref:Capsular polysaccharide biosynthesis protein n=1 Tax=Limosilactobacillus reuteri TaxID=1598 RepID=A0A0U5JJN2_LIMRT|nr:capsular polysaccharide biosynthesis protein [Limosilactobacillus reuteri subsp. porcinus]